MEEKRIIELAEKMLETYIELLKSNNQLLSENIDLRKKVNLKKIPK